MEGVEDIPGAVLNEGLPWTWQSFEQFMDALEARPYDLDIAAQVPHSPVRVFVMGRRGVEREPATEADNEAMARLAAAGVRAGALGFSTSRPPTTRRWTAARSPRSPRPRTSSPRSRRHGRRWAPAGLGDLRLRRSGRRVRDAAAGCRAQPAADGDHHPAERQRTGRLAPPPFPLADANRAGLPMIGQTLTRATGIVLGFEVSLNPFSGRPSGGHRPPAAGREARGPAAAGFRARLIAESCAKEALARRVSRWDRLFPIGTPRTTSRRPR